MTINREKILWLDLETTGTRAMDEILEIGMVVTDIEFNTIAEFEKVYYTRMSVMDIKPEVLEMHAANGLWKDIATKAEKPAPAGEDDILDFIDWHFGKDLAPLAGSGVSHFDRRFIKAWWPRFDKHLTHWHYDIGVVRRFLQLWSMLPATNIPDMPERPHRALADVYQIIDEAKRYRQMVAHTDIFKYTRPIPD